MEVIINDEILRKSIEKNKNITDADKILLSSCVNAIINKFEEKLHIKVPTENSSYLFENLVVINDYEKDTNEFVSYNQRENKLSIFWLKASKDNLGDFYYNYIYSILSILSMRYSDENKRYVSGIEYVNEFGFTNGKVLNELLKRNITVNLSNENPFDIPIKNFYYDSESYYTMYDNLLEDVLYSKIGLEKTLECFVCGQGDIIFSEFSEMIGEKDTKELYTAIDNYSSDKIKYRKKYNEILSKLGLSKIEKFNTNLM